MKTIDISKYEEIERRSNYYEEQFNKLEQENAILKKALELAVDDGDNKITNACFIDRTAYDWDSQAPSMLCEEDYIQQAKESIK